MLQTSNRPISAIYNHLPNVELADTMLSAAGRVQVLSKLSKLIVQYGLEETIGIRLLHKHNLIDENEIMLEREERDSSGRPCLTTHAIAQKDVVGGPKIANSWRTSDNRAVPIEFSVDPLVASCWRDEIVQLLKQFGVLTSKLYVSGFMGPAILPRKFYSEHRPVFPAILLERTDRSRRANVVQYEPLDALKQINFIETTWKVQTNFAGGHEFLQGCSTYCAKGACVPISACVRDDDGHTPESTHDEGEHTELHGGR